MKSPNSYFQASANSESPINRTPVNDLSIYNQIIANLVHTARLLDLNADNPNLLVTFYMYANQFNTFTQGNSKIAKWIRKNIVKSCVHYKMSTKNEKGFPQKYTILDAGLLKAIAENPILAPEDILNNMEFTDFKDIYHLSRSDYLIVRKSDFTKKNIGESFSLMQRAVHYKIKHNKKVHYVLHNTVLAEKSHRVFSLFQGIKKEFRNKMFKNEIDIRGSQFSATASWIVKNNLKAQFPCIIKMSGIKEFGYFYPNYSQITIDFKISHKETKTLVISILNGGGSLKPFLKYKNTKGFKLVLALKKEIKLYLKLRISQEPKLLASLSHKKNPKNSFLFMIYSREEEKIRNKMLEMIKSFAPCDKFSSILQVHDAVKFNFDLTRIQYQKFIIQLSINYPGISFSNSFNY